MSLYALTALAWIEGNERTTASAKPPPIEHINIAAQLLSTNEWFHTQKTTSASEQVISPNEGLFGTGNTNLGSLDEGAEYEVQPVSWIPTSPPDPFGEPREMAARLYMAIVPEPSSLSAILALAALTRPMCVWGATGGKEHREGGEYIHSDRSPLVPRA